VGHGSAYLLGDNDGAYGQAFRRRVRAMGSVIDRSHRGRRGRIHMLNA
jgi:hypothetical protein